MSRRYAQGSRIPRADMAAIIARHPLPRATLAARSGITERTIQRILYGARSGGKSRNFIGEWVNLDTADRLCLALGEALPE